MEFSIDIIHVGKIGDELKKLTINDLNMDTTVNMYLNNEHYRVNLDELEKLIKIVKSL